MLRIMILLLSLLVAAGAQAQIQLRTLPADAKRGELRHVEGMIVEIDGKRMPLSAGAQLRDRENRIVLPVAMPAGSLVKYTLDAQERVHRAWILTPEEAAQPDKPAQ
jgi:hypothetical protein